MTGRIFDIEHGSLVDGPGIRTAVFFKGCNLSCSWCHNPESQSFLPQLMIYPDRCTGCGSCFCQKTKCDLCGMCVQRCPVGARKIIGKTVSTDAVLKEILEDKPFYSTDGGVTFTGGECLLQTEFLLELLKECKENDVQTAVDTAGNVPWDVFDEILPYTDLFLFDIKAMNPDTHKMYTGADNKQILTNLRKLLQCGARVHIRIPVVPGVNDSTEEIELMKAFLAENPGWERVDLLPHHSMGENKYAALGREPKLFSVPSRERVNELSRLIGI